MRRDRPTGRPYTKTQASSHLSARTIRDARMLLKLPQEELAEADRSAKFRLSRGFGDGFEARRNNSVMSILGEAADQAVRPLIGGELDASTVCLWVETGHSSSLTPKERNRRHPNQMEYETKAPGCPLPSAQHQILQTH